jgi:hypothetical protein
MNQSSPFYLFILLATLFAYGCSAERDAHFTFTENDQGIMLTERGNPVYFYQRAPKSLDGRYVCNNYIHPLYSAGGDTLTEEFPADHPYHRGIFWAWHQIFIDGKSVGNGWIMQDFKQEVTGYRTSIRNNTARLDLDVQWKSPAWQEGTPFVREQTSIEVHPLKEDVRIIDFIISLEGLVPGVSIGGADNDRGYGGFCLRIRTPEDLIFTSANGQEIPRPGQTGASPWMDFTGSFGPASGRSGLSLVCHPETPGYPPTWILRQRTSMQNVVFPGRERSELPQGKPVVLKYRLILHDGNAPDISRDFGN